MENKDFTNYEVSETVSSQTNNSLMDLGSDNILMLAEQAEKRIAAIKKIMNAALMITNEKDWVLIQGTPYLQETGATKVARVFGVTWEFVGANPQIEVDSEGYKTFTYRMRFSLKNDSIECEGSRSMKEDFFAKSKESTKKPDEIDERDVKMSAYTNCINNGIKRLIPGIRNIGIKELENAGLNVSEIKGYTFKNGSKGGKDKDAVDEELKCSDCGSAIAQVVASYSQAKYGKMLCRDCQKKHIQGENKPPEEK